MNNLHSFPVTVDSEAYYLKYKIIPFLERKLREAQEKLARIDEGVILPELDPPKNEVNSSRTA